MKDQQAIKKLQLLKIMQPSKQTLRSIKKGVYEQVQSENTSQAYLGSQYRFSKIPAVIKSYGVRYYAGAIALLLIIFLSTSVLLFPNQTHTVLLYGKLAFAPNQYQKARIALDDTKSRFTDNKSLQTNTNELAYSLTLTNTQLNELKLKGEKGKYTAMECHQIYQEYLSYLESKEKVIPPNNTSLSTKINSYEEQAEKKLHMYKSL